MDLDEIVTQIRRAFEQFSVEMTNDIFRELDMSLKHMDPSVHWDTMINQINSRLNSWLVNQAYRRKYHGDLSRARMVLECVDHISQIKYWVREIQQIYAPIAWSVYTYRA